MTVAANAGRTTEVTTGLEQIAAPAASSGQHAAAPRSHLDPRSPETSIAAYGRVRRRVRRRRPDGTAPTGLRRPVVPVALRRHGAGSSGSGSSPRTTCTTTTACASPSRASTRSAISSTRCSSGRCSTCSCRRPWTSSSTGGSTPRSRPRFSWPAALVLVPVVRGSIRSWVFPRVMTAAADADRGQRATTRASCTGRSWRTPSTASRSSASSTATPTSRCRRRCSGRPRRSLAIVDEYEIDRVLLASSVGSHEATLDLVRTVRRPDVQVSIVPRYFEIFTSHATLDDVEGMPVVTLPPMRLGRSSRLLKRSVDVVVSGLALLLLAPVLAAIAVAIRLDSKGTALYRQPRRGRLGSTFHIVKFRTMHVGAEQRAERGPAHERGRRAALQDQGHGPARNASRRASSAGRASTSCRSSGTCCKGEMSLVGPRPFVVYEADKITGWASRRLDMTPGITGLWQVLGRNDIPFEEMTKLDYLYVTNWSLWWDLKILCQTIPVVLGRRGAYWRQRQPRAEHLVEDPGSRAARRRYSNRATTVGWAGNGADRPLDIARCHPGGRSDHSLDIVRAGKAARSRPPRGCRARHHLARRREWAYPRRGTRTSCRARWSRARPAGDHASEGRGDRRSSSARSTARRGYPWSLRRAACGNGEVASFSTPARWSSSTSPQTAPTREHRRRSPRQEDVRPRQDVESGKAPSSARRKAALSAQTPRTRCGGSRCERCGNSHRFARSVRREVAGVETVGNTRPCVPRVRGTQPRAARPPRACSSRSRRRCRAAASFRRRRRMTMEGDGNAASRPAPMDRRDPPPRVWRSCLEKRGPRCGRRRAASRRRSDRRLRSPGAQGRPSRGPTIGPRGI